MFTPSKEERLENARRKLKEYRSTHKQNVTPLSDDITLKQQPISVSQFSESRVDKCNNNVAIEVDAFVLTNPSSYAPVLTPPNVITDSHQNILQEGNQSASECCSSSPIDEITTFTTEKVAQISQELNHMLSSNFDLHQHSGTPSEAATTGFLPSDLGNDGNNAFRTGSHFSLPNSWQGISRDSISASSILIRELQQRNLELATLLEQRNDKHDRAMATAESLRDQLHRLKLSSEEEKRIIEVSMQRELAKMRSQLRAHSQTVGSLVAEKTELEAKLEHLERAAQARCLEVQSLTANGNDVRAKLREVEDELRLARSASSHSEAAKTEALNQLIQWQMEVKQEKDLRKRLGLELKNREESLVRLEADVKRLALSNEDLARQLEIAMIFSKSGTPSTTESGTPAVTFATELKSPSNMSCTRCESLGLRIQELETREVHTSAEKAHLELQYKAYVADMEMQVAQLRSQVEKSKTKFEGLQHTREELLLQLKVKEAELVETARELKRLQTDQANRNAVESTADAVNALNSRIEKPPLGEAEVKESVFYKELELTSNALKNKITELSERLSETVDSLSSAEACMADRQVVLVTAASERAALSRAMEQNAALKDRLTHMQDALDIAKRSNEEMEAELCELRLQVEGASSPCVECESLKAQLSNPDRRTSSTMTFKIEEEGENHSNLASERKSSFKAISKDSESADAVMMNTSAPHRDVGTAIACQTECSFVRSEEVLSQLRADLVQSKADYAELEQRFAQLSDRLVASDGEKLRLEGLIAQLEMESSTIDEYVTMFAHRRQVLLKRAKIRDALLLRLIGDRNELRQRLQSLYETANAVIASSFPQNGGVERDPTPLMAEFEKALTDFRTNLDTSSLDSSLDLDDDDSDENNGHAKATQSGLQRQDEGVLLDDQLRRYVSTADDCLNCEICSGSLLII